MEFSFDFLDYKDGCIIEVQHNGNNETEINAEGIILGVTNGVMLAKITKVEKILSGIRSNLASLFKFSPKIEHPLYFRRASLRKKLLLTLIVLIASVIFVSPLVLFFDALNSGLGLEVKTPFGIISITPPFPSFPLEFIVTSNGVEISQVERTYYSTQIIASILVFIFVALAVFISIWKNPVPFPEALDFDREKV